MTIRRYDLATCTCSISASEPVHATMSHYLSAFEVPEADHPDIELMLRIDSDVVAQVQRSLATTPPIALRSSHPEHRYGVWIADGRQTLMPENAPDHVIVTRGNHVLATTTADRVAATIGVRITRQLIMRGGEAYNGRAVHAGAVTINGYGVLVGGHPGAGKTSVLTRLVEDHGAWPMANDRTMLIPGDDSSWYAVGVPLAWRFTPEGISGSPRLTAALVSRHPTRGRDLVDGKVELTPLEVRQIFGSSAVAMTRISRMVILSRSAGGTTTPDATLVREHLDFGAHDFFAEDWLDIRTQLSGHIKQTVSDWGAWWSRLAGSLPSRVLRWTNVTELPQVTAAIAGADR